MLKKLKVVVDELIIKIKTCRDQTPILEGFPIFLYYEEIIKCQNLLC